MKKTIFYEIDALTDGREAFLCSHCHKETTLRFAPAYCPSCGRKVRRVKDALGLAGSPVFYKLYRATGRNPEAVKAFIACVQGDDGRMAACLAHALQPQA